MVNTELSKTNLKFFCFMNIDLDILRQKQGKTSVPPWDREQFVSIQLESGSGNSKKGNFDIRDRPRSGRPMSIDVDDLIGLIEEDPRLTLKALAVELNCSHTTVATHLRKLGKTWKFGAWIPHTLSLCQQQKRLLICKQLMESLDIPQLQNGLVTGDEKWVLYVNIARTRQWLSAGQKGVPTPKQDLHPKKIMLSVWRNAEGVIHWELLQTEPQ